MDNITEKKTNIFVASSIGCGISILLALLFMLVSTVITLTAENPMSYTWLGIAALFIFAAAGGFISEKIHKHAPLPTGLLSGGMYAVIVFCSSLLIPQSAERLWYIPVVLVCAVFGALIGNIKVGGKKLPSFDDKKYISTPKG